MDSKLCDLRKDINDQTSKLKRKAPSFRLESHRIQFEFNSDIQEGLEKLSSGIRQQDAGLCADLISKLKKRNKLIKVADRSPGAGLQSANTRNPVCAGVIPRTIKAKTGRNQSNKKAKIFSLPLFNLTRLTMFLTKFLILSCLLTSLVPGPASSFRVDKRGVEVVDWRHFGRKDKPQHQTYAFPAGSRDINAGSAPTESTPTVSSYLGGTPVSCSNPKEKAEIPSQQLQKIIIIRVQLMSAVLAQSVNG